MDKNLGFSTKTVHAGERKNNENAHATPIYQSSTFTFESADDGAKCFSGEKEGFVYTRIGNPTIAALEKSIAELEGGKKGLAFSSGMAAISAASLALVEKGSHLICGQTLYGCTTTLFLTEFPKLGIEVSFVDTTKAKNVKEALRPNTKFVFLETPANPTMEVCDIKAIAKITKERGIDLLVDNTFATPYNQRPLELGATVVIHSLTKYLNGHGDVVAGIVVGSEGYVKDKLKAKLVNFGGNMSPEDAYRVIRGLKTFSLRMERHNYNAMNLAKFLESHPKIETVLYPGLKSHPQHKIAKKQMITPSGKAGYGGMMSFEVKGGKIAGKKLMDYLAKNSFITLAVSLGTTDTLIQHPASMTHAKVPPEERLKSGITEGLVRISVGLEDYKDLEETLKKALDKI